MANIRQTDTAAGRTRPGMPDDAELEMTLEAAERLRSKNDRPLFGVHPDGIGQTLGGDLGQPNLGHAADWEDESYDPPT